MGSALGRLWVAGGHDVCFSYKRDDRQLKRLADETGAKWASVRDTVADADVVLLSVHWSRIDDALEQAGDLDGKIVLNSCIPLNDSDTMQVVGRETSGAEYLASKWPRARWVSCFNTAPSESMPNVFARKGKPSPPQQMLYGEDRDAKTIAGQLARDIGFEPVDLGGLANGRYVEPFAMVTAVLAYETPGGPSLTYRFEKL